MKKISLSFFVGILVLSGFSAIDQAQAVPVGAGQHSGQYIFGAEDLGRWTVGLCYLDRERDIVTLGHATSFQATKTFGYVAYEFLYGMNAYLLVGGIESQFGGLNLVDNHAEVGVGVQFNILDHEIPDPLLMEDRIRVNASLQYTSSGADWIATEIEWEEIYGTLTVSFVNDIRGDKRYHMNSIGVFFGVVYSDLKSSSIDEDSAFGYMAGVDIHITENVLFEVGLESLDDGAIFGGIHIAL